MTDMPSRFLIFGVDGDRYAIALQDVAEVMEPVPIFPMPKAPHCYTGVINCHGMPVPVLDLAAFYKKPSFGDSGKILVLNRNIASLALHVENVLDIVFDTFVRKPADDSHEGVEKLLIDADGEIKLLSSGKLLEILEEKVNSRE